MLAVTKIPDLIIDENVLSKLNTCKKNKTCGQDQIYYELIMYGGKRL